MLIKNYQILLKRFKTTKNKDNKTRKILIKLLIHLVNFNNKLSKRKRIFNNQNRNIKNYSY